MMDLSKLSDDDLMALRSGDLSRVSDAGLMALRGAPAQVTPQAAPRSPVEDMSPAERFVTGFGQGMMRAGRAVKQAIDVPAVALERTFGGQRVSRALGMPTAQESAQVTRQNLAEAEALDAPLLATGAGRAGSIGGQVASVLPTAFVPGANTYMGATLLGAGTSALTTPGDISERALAGLGGAVGGAAGKAAGDVIGSAASKMLSRAQARGQAQAAGNAVKDATIREARQAGYVLPPTSAREGFINRTLESVSGKAQTQQAAAVANQQVTNRLAMEALTEGLDPAVAETIKRQPITPDLLRSIREGAGGVYESMANTGRVMADSGFTRQVRSLGQQAEKLRMDFPELRTAGADDILSLVRGLNVPEFDARSGVELVKNLRAESSANLSFQAAADPAKKALGKAQKAAADAVEELLERHAGRLGQPQLGQAFRDARTLIAKTYTVENSLNEATGNVVARELAKQLDKGKPLSPKLQTAAKFAGAFPKAAEEIRQSPGISALDFFGSSAASLGTGNPLFMGAIAARPAVRSAILSSPYQNALVNPSYGPSLLTTGGLNSLRIGSRAGMPVGMVGANSLVAQPD